MTNLNSRQTKILAHYRQEEGFTPAKARADLSFAESLVTVRRDIRALVERGFLRESGAGPALQYFKTTLGLLLSPVDASNYQNIDIDKRGQRVLFNHNLFPDFPDTIFSITEINHLNNATTSYRKRIENQTTTIQNKELERFVIELSWKSSKIEGNTYSLLDTELLLKEGIIATGKTQVETTMILNHKKAFAFVMEQKDSFQKQPLHIFVEELHKILTADLEIDQGIRKLAVGITGTNYTPLDINYQIQEALENLYIRIGRAENDYQKALLALVGISYIQPFADGNKRTARLLANAFLVAKKLAPLSYRNVNEKDYREAILVFYELNSIVPMKNIFLEQYLFSSENYAV